MLPMQLLRSLRGIVKFTAEGSFEEELALLAALRRQPTHGITRNHVRAVAGARLV